MFADVVLDCGIAHSTPLSVCVLTALAVLSKKITFIFVLTHMVPATLHALFSRSH